MAKTYFHIIYDNEFSLQASLELLNTQQVIEDAIDKGLDYDEILNALSLAVTVGSPALIALIPGAATLAAAAGTILSVATAARFVMGSQKNAILHESAVGRSQISKCNAYWKKNFPAATRIKQDVGVLDIVDDNNKTVRIVTGYPEVPKSYFINGGWVG